MHTRPRVSGTHATLAALMALGLGILPLGCGSGGTAAPSASASQVPHITSFTATPSSVTPGGTVTLSWSVSGATHLRIDPGIGTVTGSSVQAHPTVATTYTLTAANAAGTHQVHTTVAMTPQPGAGFIIDHTCVNLPQVPSAAITAAKSTLKIAYGHTSHGSQLITGMDALAAGNSLYSWNEDGTGGALKLDDYAMDGDVGYHPDWVNNTRAYLGTPNPSTGRGTSHADINVVIWSWCGQAASRTQQTMIDTYLTPMTQLEAEYPGIQFVYMTGHLDGSGSPGNLHQRNEQIRSYCRTNHKILFDFAAIESHDPSGTVDYLPLFATDGCEYDTNGDGNPWGDGNWASEWIAAHPADPLTILASSCGECAHSQTLNCIQKGRAAWWLWARLAGWSGN